jgi:hypothetical protein
MIMGNTVIALPTDTIMNTPDPSIWIPDGPTKPESRSVLMDEITNVSSPGSLTVLPAFGSQRNKTKNATVEIKDSKSVAGKPLTTEIESKIPVVSKRTVSWAEVASRGKSW